MSSTALVQVSPDPAVDPDSAPSTAQPSLRRRLADFAKPDDRRALLQLCGTAVPFFLGWVVMVWSLDVSYFLTLALAVPMVGLYTRMFIFQHDCGHGAYFRSRRANHVVGSIIGVLTLTPYFYWRRTHAHHHAGHGDLDRRGQGDISTLTVREYLALPWWRRLGYRLYRHPLVFLGIGPFYTFALKHRLPLDAPLSWTREWLSVLGTNLALAAIAVGAHLTFGLDKLLLVYAPVFFLGTCLGVWLFYVQHQFEDAYWAEHGDWSFERAGLEGSSFLDLPPILHWFTGNIGFHHIHHLASRIPNYRLPAVQRSVPELQQATRLSLAESFRCARLKLWDEAERRMVPFAHLRRRRPAAA